MSSDLSAMPSGSTLLDVTLELNRETDSMVGDPYDLGDITVDLKTGGFNDNTAMENADFEAAPTQANVATLVDGQPATAAINSAGLAAIQTALGQSESNVQLRLQYTVDDNNNSTSDYQSYYSDSTSTGGRHPALIIHYTLAD